MAAGISSTEAFRITTKEQLAELVTKIVGRFLMPSVSLLETRGVKNFKGNTVLGHAIILMHHLMTLQEMQDAIKHGHPGCIL